MRASAKDRPPATVFIIAGEESGDMLGAGLMTALSERFGGRIRYLGVGGTRMEKLGLASLFPMEEISLHGLSEVLLRLPRLLGLIRQTARAVAEAKPDVLVVVDTPGFNLRVAKRVRELSPGIPIVDYVSPSVWAWAPGRAKKMAALSIACWRSCHSNRPCIAASAVRRPPTSATRCSSAWRICGRRPASARH